MEHPDPITAPVPEAAASRPEPRTLFVRDQIQILYRFPEDARVLLDGSPIEGIFCQTWTWRADEAPRPDTVDLCTDCGAARHDR